MRTIVFVGLLITANAHAGDLMCAEDQATQRRHCYAPSELRETDGIRSARYYSGGPKSVRATPYTIAINCQTLVTHLKDRDGVSFAGGQALTPPMRALRDSICAETLRRRK